MKINIDKFIQTYRIEVERNKKIYGLKFILPVFVWMFFYSMGYQKFGEKAIYHVFMLGICAIFCTCWTNIHQNPKEK